MLLVAQNNLDLEEKSLSDLSSKTISNMTESQISPEKTLNGLDIIEKNDNHISDICVNSNHESKISQICDDPISTSCDLNGDNHINDSNTCLSTEIENAVFLETSTDVTTNNEELHNKDDSIEDTVEKLHLPENNSNSKNDDVGENLSDLAIDSKSIEDEKVLENISEKNPNDSMDLEKMNVDIENCLLDKNSPLDQDLNGFVQEIKSETTDSLCDAVEIDEESDQKKQISSQNSDVSEIKPTPENQESKEISKAPVLENGIFTNFILMILIFFSLQFFEFSDHMVYIASTNVLTEMLESSENSSKTIEDSDINEDKILDVLQEIEDKKKTESEKNTTSLEESKSQNVKKKDSIIIDTLDLLLSDDESDFKKEKSEKTTVVVSDKTESKESILMDEDDDLLLIEDESNKDGTGHKDITNNKDENNCQENVSKSPFNDTITINTANKNLESSESNKTEEFKDSFSPSDKNISISVPLPEEFPSTSKGIIFFISSEYVFRFLYKFLFIYIGDSIISGSLESISTSENRDTANVDMCSATSNSADNDPIIPLNFMKTFKTSLARMTRDDLEEYCIVKIVEAIVKRSNLSKAEGLIKSQMKSNDALRKKIAYLSKQQKDLEVVMKSLCSEHKKRKDEFIEPVKISRSVGFQVGPNLMKNKKLPPLAPIAAKDKNNKSMKINIPKTNPLSPIKINKNGNSVPKKLSNTNQKTSTDDVKSVKNDPPSSILKNVLSTNFVNDNGLIKQISEKRPLDQSIDLTDDEPPAKQMALNNRSKSTSPNTRLHSPPNTNTPVGNKIMMYNQTSQQQTNSGLQKSNSYRPRNPSLPSQGRLIKIF